jgi:hypothetical protein
MDEVRQEVWLSLRRKGGRARVFFESHFASESWWVEAQAGVSGRSSPRACAGVARCDQGVVGRVVGAMPPGFVRAALWALAFVVAFGYVAILVASRS